MPSSIGEPDGRAVDILLVEDNPGDVDLTKEILAETTIKGVLHTVGDGGEALAFLRREGVHVHAPRPDLILLDLNLPRMDGREALHEIKSDAKLCTIPVIVLTTSNRREDVERSYALHANCYVIKPVDLGGFERIVRSIEDFWLSIVTLPSRTNHHARDDHSTHR